MLKFNLSAQRVNADFAVAEAKSVKLELDISAQGSPNALNPIELVLAAQAACFIKGVGRLAPLINFEFQSVRVELEATRTEGQASISQIDYRIWVGTTETVSRLSLLHNNLQRHGTIYNLLTQGTSLQGEIFRELTTSNKM